MSICWKNSNVENMKLAAAEYEARLQYEEELYVSLENKARWLLSVAIPLITLVGGYLLNTESAEGRALWSGIIFLLCMLVSSVLASASIFSRTYNIGRPVPDSLVQWKDFIENGNKEQKYFYGRKLEVAETALRKNIKSNKSKGNLVRISLMAAMAAIFLPVIPWFVC